jgi:hydrogenase-4 membrane subunit HyfE
VIPTKKKPHTIFRILVDISLLGYFATVITILLTIFGYFTMNKGTNITFLIFGFSNVLLAFGVILGNYDILKNASKFKKMENP